jgi:hypothetical protein
MFAEPLLITTSSAISWMVKRRSSMIHVPILSITSAFQLIDGLPERWSLAIDMQPSLKQLSHCLI